MQVEPTGAILDIGEIKDLFLCFSHGSHLLLAVSGGPDSLAMMKLAMMHLASEFVRDRTDVFKLSAATVNHGLRVEAQGEAQYVADVAARLGISHHVLEWQGKKPLSKIQELARVARYELLFAHALKIGATHVLTAHTLDDQAETILFRMMRGSGIKGLVGMESHVKQGNIIHSRPLLGIAKERLVATCKAHDLNYVDDASNSNTQFARVRLRKILPLLALEGLTARRFSNLSSRLKRADEALEARVSNLWECGKFYENRYDLKHITAEPAEIVLRYLIKLIKHSYSSLYTDTHFKHLRLNSVEAVLDGFHSALQNGKAFKHSISGLVLELHKDGCVYTRVDPRSKMSMGI